MPQKEYENYIKKIRRKQHKLKKKQNKTKQKNGIYIFFGFLKINLVFENIVKKVIK